MRRLTPTKLWGTLALLAGVSGAAILAGVAFGSIPAGLGEVASALARSWDAAGGAETLRRMARGGFDDPRVNAVCALRVPVVLLAFFVGASLSSAGTGLQAILRNPLADPFVLGVSGGAAVGAAAAVVAGLGERSATALPAAAFLGAAASVGLVHLLAGGGRVPPERLLLTGFVANLVASSLVLLLIYVARPGDKDAILTWLTGRVPQDRATYLAVGLVGALSVVGLAILQHVARDLDLLSGGDRAARTLGVSVARTRGLVFLAASLVTGASVALTGLIGFVGIIVPHGLRLWLGPDHRLLVPASFLAGGAFLCLADAVARSALAPEVIPVGVVTSLVGGPAFIFLLRRRFRAGLL